MRLLAAVSFTEASTTFKNKDGLLAARDAWCADAEKANSTYGPIGQWNVSAVKDFTGVFCGSSKWPFFCNSACSSFNDDVNGWDTSQVTTLAQTFYGASAFNQTLDQWDTARVTSLSYCFNLASAFDQPLEQWDTSSMTTLKAAFQSTGAFNQPLEQWDTSRVSSMSFLLHYAYAFNQPLEHWDTSRVSDLELRQLPKVLDEEYEDRDL